MKLSWNTCLRAGISIFVLYLCIRFWPGVENLLKTLLGAATPLLIGCVIAYILNIPMSAYERLFFPHSQKKAVKKLRRPVCLIAALLSLAAVIALVVWLVVPQLLSCIQLIIEEIPDFFEKLLEKAEKTGIFTPETIGKLENIDWASRIGQIAGVVTTGIGSVAEKVISVVTSVFSGIVTGFLSVIFAVYLLIGRDTLKRQYHTLVGRYLKQPLIKKIDYVADIFNNCFHRYIVGQCTEAVILGLLCMLGMWILKLPYPSMIGTLIAFTALIPVAGAWIGGAVGAFMILTVSPMKVLIFLLFLVILQQLENNLIYPKVVGTSMGLPAMWVLAAVTLGGGILGVVGMLLGVPTAAAIYRIVREDVHKANKKPTADQQE